MRQFTKLHLRPTVVAHTPRHLGINIETQDFAERTNLWDWIADSGITVAREFHPEQNFRLSPSPAGTWGQIATKADFEAWRRRILANPRSGDPHGIQWHNYSFDKPLKWMGVPDAIIAKLHQIGVTPLHSLGYAPAFFPRPLVKDLSFIGTPGEEHLDWEAAASAYDYYFACLYHFAVEVGREVPGPRYFTMVNEPENRWGWWHLPADFDALKGKDWWGQLFWDDDPAITGDAVAFAGRAGGASEGGGQADLQAEKGALARRYIDLISTQYAALARLARLALNDVQALLGAPGPKLMLAGPTAVMWEQFTRKAADFLDVCTFHYYHPDPAAYPPAFAAVAEEATKHHKPVGITEFNRLSGGLPIEQSLFGFDNSLAVAKLLMTVLGLSRTGEPAVEFLAFYLLHFPSTHRNYKHLLYGDMNTLDWTGRDTPLRNRTDAWYPTFEEQQVRFATPAYAMFRMLTRTIRHGATRHGPHPILSYGLSNPTSAASQDVYSDLGVLVVQQPDQVIVTLLNPNATPARNLQIDLSRLAGTYRWALVRETSKAKRDQLVAQVPVAGGTVTVDVAGPSLTQILLTAAPLDQVRGLELLETTATPGSLAHLELHQTTRLRALATLTDGSRRDLTDVAVVWESSEPELVRVDQGGLVQRMRGGGVAKVTARTLDGTLRATAEVA